MKSILATGLLLCLAYPTLHVTGQEPARDEKAASQGADKGKANSTDNPIEVKTDRFSNKITVTLKPQVILDKPDHFMTLDIDTALGEKAFSALERESIKAAVKFESQSKEPVDFGDQELHFLINGRSLNAGKLRFEFDPSDDPKPGFKVRKFAVAIFDRDDLQTLSKANRIEMRLGSIEPALSNMLVTTLREYAVQVLAQHKIAKEKQ